MSSTILHGKAGRNPGNTPSLEDLRAELESLLNDDLHRLIDAVPHPAHAAIEHLLSGGGKRLRPLLALLSAGAVGGSPEQALPVALAVELLHSGSLLHDDVVDESDRRRGRPAARKVWGNQVAVLAGDYCIFAAVNALLIARDHEVLQRAMDVGNGLCSGELDQLQRRFTSALASESEYLSVIEQKTANLIAFACWAGGRLGGASPEVSESLHGFGRDVGTAFQILDDILDITATEAEFGKAPGQDIRDGVVTLPTVYAIQEDAKIGTSLERLANLAQPRTDDEAGVQDVLARIRATSAIERCLKKAEQVTTDALTSLEILDDGVYRDVLHALAHDLLTRIR